MSGITGVSSVAFQSVEEAWQEKSPKVSGKVGVNISNNGRKTKGSVTAGGSVKNGRGTSSVSVKVDDDGKISTTLGHGVTIPVGDAKVKLGAKYTRKTDVNRLIQWFFWLFGRAQRPQPRT